MSRKIARYVAAVVCTITCVCIYMGRVKNFKNNIEEDAPNPSRESQRSDNIKMYAPEYTRLIELKKYKARPEITSKIGAFCRSEILQNGNYRYAFLSMKDASDSEKFEILNMIIGISSPSGLEVDLVNQLDLIGDFKNTKVILLKNTLYDRVISGGGVNKNLDILDLIPQEDLNILSSRLARSFNEGFFEIANEISKRTNKFDHIAEGVNILLNQDAISGSSMISKLEDGPIKDESIFYMVKWLIGKGSTDEANQWINQIANPKIRARALSDAR